MAGEVGILVDGAGGGDCVEGAAGCECAGGCGDLGLEGERAGEVLVGGEVDAVGARDDAELWALSGRVGDPQAGGCSVERT